MNINKLNEGLALIYDNDTNFEMLQVYGDCNIISKKIKLWIKNQHVDQAQNYAPPEEKDYIYSKISNFSNEINTLKDLIESFVLLENKSASLDKYYSLQNKIKQFSKIIHKEMEDISKSLSAEINSIHEKEQFSPELPASEQFDFFAGFSSSESQSLGTKFDACLNQINSLVEVARESGKFTPEMTNTNETIRYEFEMLLRKKSTCQDLVNDFKNCQLDLNQCFQLIQNALKDKWPNLKRTKQLSQIPSPNSTENFINSISSIKKLTLDMNVNERNQSLWMIVLDKIENMSNILNLNIKKFDEIRSEILKMETASFLIRYSFAELQKIKAASAEEARKNESFILEQIKNESDFKELFDPNKFDQKVSTSFDFLRPLWKEETQEPYSFFITSPEKKRLPQLFYFPKELSIDELLFALASNKARIFSQSFFAGSEKLNRGNHEIIFREVNNTENPDLLLIDDLIIQICLLLKDRDSDSERIITQFNALDILIQNYQGDIPKIGFKINRTPQQMFLFLRNLYSNNQSSRIKSARK